MSKLEVKLKVIHFANVHRGHPLSDLGSFPITIKPEVEKTQG